MNTVIQVWLNYLSMFCSHAPLKKSEGPIRDMGSDILSWYNSSQWILEEASSTQLASFPSLGRRLVVSFHKIMEGVELAKISLNVLIYSVLTILIVNRLFKIPPSSDHLLYDGWLLGHEQQTLHGVSLSCAGPHPLYMQNKRREIAALKVLQLIGQSNNIYTPNLHLRQAKKLIRL